MTNKELLKMEALYGFMGKSWEYMGLPSGYDLQRATENGHVEYL